MHDVIDVAEYMVNYCEVNLNKPITNLQLQKFLYYVQGVTLAIKNIPMFINEIEAWRYGPVVPDAYYWFNDNSSNKISGIKPKNSVLNNEEKSIINFVANELIDIEPWKLVEKTHLEDPWRESYIQGYNQIISNNEIQGWFKRNF